MFFQHSKTVKQYDLVVIGNSLAAVMSAGTIAKNGKTVALVTQSELLCGEASESLLGFTVKGSPLFDVFAQLDAVPAEVGGEYHVPCGMAAKVALNYLIENKVHTFLKAAPIGLLTGEAGVGGIAVATKFGAYAIKSKLVVDFSDRTFYKNMQTEPKDYTFAFQMGNVDLSAFQLPTCLDVSVEDAKDVMVHGDCRSDDTCVITFQTSKKYASDAIDVALGVAQYCINTYPAFAQSGILKYSLRPVSSTVYSDMPQKNLLRFHTGNMLRSEDYYRALVSAMDLIRTCDVSDGLVEPNYLQTTYGEFPLDTLYDGGELDEFLGAQLLKLHIPTETMPQVNTELFIAGLGAGGGAAMKAALESGVKVVGAEALPVPAGTKGQGMVWSFWHGYQDGFATKNLQAIKEFAKEQLGEYTLMPTAEITYDVKCYTGAAVFYESLVFNTIKENGATCGAVLATPGGLVKITAHKLIDATGDADLAKLSDVEYMPNGDPRDRVTQGFSVWGYDKIGTTLKDSRYKSDEDSISTERYSEFLRGIYIAHLKQSDLGFSALLTVRESRRIKGKFILNMKDILRGTLFDDTISVSLCQYDAHGVGSSPAYYTQLFDATHQAGNPDLVTRIPLRALLPCNDEGLMVISKAISATRDAGCLVRMNADIQNTGYAAGMIAAVAAKQKTGFESAYTDDLKRQLVEKHILPKFYNELAEISVDSLCQQIRQGDLFAMMTASAHPELLPEFENAYDEDKGVGQVLLALGSGKSFDEKNRVFSSCIEAYKQRKEQANQIKSYAVLLSRVAVKDETKKAAFIPVLAEAIQTIDAGGGYGNPELGNYRHSKVSCRVVPNFRVIMGLCIAAETVADKALAGPLMALSRKKNIRLSDGDEIHSVQLYLRIMAAAARCGDARAVKELEKYVNCERLFFREFVSGELQVLRSAKTDVVPVGIGEFWI